MMTAAIYYLLLFAALLPVGYGIAALSERIRERSAS